MLVCLWKLCFVAQVSKPLGILLLVFCALGVRGQTNLNVNPPSARVAIEFRRGDLMVPVRVNAGSTFSFKLDSGFGISTIHPDLVEPLQLRPVGRLRIEGIAGDEQATTYNGANFDVGGFNYSPRRLAVIPSDAQRRRRDRDGILGAGFFRRFVVELDPIQRVLTLYEPENYTYTGKGEILPLDFRRDTPAVTATLRFTNREPVKGRFEIDTGCDGAICLGHDFITANELEAAATMQRPSSRYGVGGSVATRNGELPQFEMGGVKLERLPASFFLEGSPVDPGFAGHIGLGTLRKFKVIFDYSRRRMILEPLK